MDSIITALLAQGLGHFFAWISSIGGVAIAVPMLIEGLKRWQRIPWLDEHSAHVNRVVAILAATMASSGISYAYDDTVGQFLVTGVTPLGIAHFLVDVASQFGLQELAYRYLVKARRA